MTYSLNSCTKTNMGDSKVDFEFYPKLHSDSCGSFLQIYTPLHAHTPLHAQNSLLVRTTHSRTTLQYKFTPHYTTKLHYKFTLNCK